MMDNATFVYAPAPQSHQGVCADAVATLEAFTAGCRCPWSGKPEARGGRLSRAVIRQEPCAGSPRGRQPCAESRRISAPQTTLEGLAGLKPAFTRSRTIRLTTRVRPIAISHSRQISGTSTSNFVHHAGQFSGRRRRSAAILLASPNYAKAHG